MLFRSVMFPSHDRWSDCIIAIKDLAEYKMDFDEIILVPGNHDWMFERSPQVAQEECDKADIVLLNDSGFILKSMNDPNIHIKIWGSPITPFL